MKKPIGYLSVLALFAFLLFTAPACSPKTGCPINETAHIQPNKKGKYPRTRTRSGLFPKKMKKHK